MKTFLLKLLVFGTLVFVFCFALGELKFSDEFLIEKTKGTAYEKVGWNIDIIKNHKDKIKNSRVFLGSSYVLNGVNDSILNKNGIKSINLAIRHNGNDLSLYFLKRIISFEPKEVIFLKGKTEFQNLHKLTPLLFSSSDLIANGQTFNLKFVSHLFKRTKLSLEYINSILKQNKEEVLINENKNGIRYEKTPLSKEIYYSDLEIKKLQKEDERFNIYKTNFLFRDEVESPSYLNNIKALKREYTLKYYSHNDWVTNFRSQENFIEKAKEICFENKVVFSQLYMPVVSDVVSNLHDDSQTYFMPLKSDATTIYFMKDYSFLNKNEYWADYHHLTQTGSIVFTQKFINEHLSY